LTPLGLDAREELAVSLNNLVVLYHAQASYREAEPLFLRALPLLNPETGRSDGGGTRWRPRLRLVRAIPFPKYGEHLVEFGIGGGFGFLDGGLCFSENDGEPGFE
jgi:hypothetical protein